MKLIDAFALTCLSTEKGIMCSLAFPGVTLRISEGPSH